MTTTALTPLAWLCELAMEDGTTRTQIVTENPAGIRWNDAGEPSPFRVTPLVAIDAALAAPAVPAGFVPMSAWLAACAFIDSHVADPDITAEMVKAYAEFARQRAMLAAAPKE